jgi:hypothetical protein
MVRMVDLLSFPVDRSVHLRAAAAAGGSRIAAKDCLILPTLHDPAAAPGLRNIGCA